VDAVPLNISALASVGRLALSFMNRVKFPPAPRVAMRLRTLVNRLIWLGIAAYLAYAALLAASSYVQVKETVEQAVADSRQRQKAAVATGPRHDQQATRLSSDCSVMTIADSGVSAARSPD
jgi:hypothetical protein